MLRCPGSMLDFVPGEDTRTDRCEQSDPRDWRWMGPASFLRFAALRLLTWLTRRDGCSRCQRTASA